MIKYMYYDINGKPISGEIWRNLFENMAYRGVAESNIGSDIRISTVWLGLDHRHIGEGKPIIFETMVNTGGEWGEQERYCTLLQAKKGHKRMVIKILAKIWINYWIVLYVKLRKMFGKV